MADPWTQFIIDMRDFVCGKKTETGVAIGAYTVAEFAEALLAFDGIIYEVVKADPVYRNAVFVLLRDLSGKQGNKYVAELAIALIAPFPRRPDTPEVMKRAKGYAGQNKAVPPHAPPQAPEDAPVRNPLPDIPAELAELIQQKSNGQARSLDEVAADLRVKLREKDYKDYCLPGRLHLSHAGADRLAAVLALEAWPNADYVRWLAERVVVEPPVLGILAAQALIAGTVRLDRQHLDPVIRSVAAAVERLDSMSEADPPPPARYNLSARRDQIGIARRLAELRKSKVTPVMSSGDFDRFLHALRGFNWADFAGLCLASLIIQLDRFADPAEPVELAIVAVVLATLRMSELKLVHAAAAARPQDPTFAAIAARYPDHAANVPARPVNA